ncbi:MAG: hypothetical protein OXH46_02705 [Gemmatimonadetes bacterium]|nr:hypothetical protein [Gemmatimonadota bacterium]
MIRRFTRNGRDAALVAALVQALEPRFEAIDARFDTMRQEMAAQFATLSETVVHGFSRPEPA